jgi:hypothetical protein
VFPDLDPGLYDPKNSEKLQIKNQCCGSETSKFSCLLLFEDTFTVNHSSNIKSQKQVPKKYKDISYFFACLWKDPDPYKIMTDPDPGGPKTCGS